ncbi:MAG: DUF2207 domain-containing protein, partial [Ruminococcaceae bacterium]|nr:DUF2207 domain-containing protein [Oscillospiraceae bacterium]
MRNNKLTRRLFCLLLCAAVFCFSLCTAAGATAADGDITETSGPSPSDLSFYAVWDNPPATLYHGDPEQAKNPELQNFLNAYTAQSIEVYGEALYYSGYDVDMTVNPDRSVDVVETIDALFIEQMHGIVRDLSTYSSDEAYRIDDISVDDWNYRVEGDSIRIGSSLEFVDGWQRFVIRYTVVYMDDIIPDYDRIYRDVLGTGNDMTICNLTARIHLPAAISDSDLIVYSDSYGSGSDKVSTFVDGDTIYMHSNRHLSPCEPVTVDIRLPEGSFSEPSLLQPDFYVDSYDYNVEIDKYGDGIVTETYKLRSPNGLTFSRSIASFPVALDCDGEYFIDDIQYSVNGSQFRGSDFDYVSVNVGDQPVELKIRYKVLYSSNRLDNPGTFEFFPATYNDQLTAYENISISVTSEAGLGNTLLLCGDRITSNAEKNDPTVAYGFVSKQDGNTFTAESFGSFPAGQTVTVSAENTGRFVHKTTTADFVFPGLGALLAAVVAFFALNKKEKDLVPTMEYYAPGGLNPAEVGHIIDGTSDAEDITALVYYWASHGHLALEMTSNKHFTLHRLTDLDASHRVYEHTMFNALWKLGDGISVTDRQLNNSFYISVNKAQQSVGKVFTGAQALENPKRRGLLNVILIAFAVLFLGAAFLLRQMGSNLFEAVYSLVFVSLFVYLAGTHIYKNKHKRKPRFFIILMIIAAFVIGIGVSALVIPGRAIGMPASLATFVLVAGTMLFFNNIRARSDFGTDLLGRCIGFKQFLETAEKSRLEMLLEENPDYYYDILPYAQVLDVSDIWMDKFEGMITRPPSWYRGTDFSPATFNTILMNNMRTMNRSMVSQPSSSGSSSGSFGGGFSGGGGFGGG